MPLVIDHREKLGNGPGTHVLICGISEYPHLVGGSGESTRFHAGFGQLSSAARTSFAIYRWLEDHADDLVPPLATCRLLVAPSPGELSPQETDSLETDQLPTLDNFLRAARDWKEDASTHPDGMTILYVTGHGFAIGQVDQIFLLHDFGDGLGSTLRNSTNIQSIWQGMAATPSYPDMARKQLYFVDTSQRDTRMLDEFMTSRPSDVFNTPMNSSEDRAAIIFYAAAHGQQAHAHVDGLTLFGEVLLDSLEGKAAAVTADGTWAVTTSSLIRYLVDELDRVSSEHGIEQKITVGGIVRDVVVAQLQQSPLVDVQIELPDEGTKLSSISISNSNFESVFDHLAPVPEDLRIQLQAGIYLVEATGSEQGSYRTMLNVVPGINKRLKIDLSEA